MNYERFEELVPKPTNKRELLEACDKEWARLQSYVDSLTKEQLHGEFPTAMMNRNVSDVLCHLHHWHILLLGWHKSALRGVVPDMPALGYKWNETPALNREINQLYSESKIAASRKLLTDSHSAIRTLIEEHSDEELFTKRYYDWTGSTSLGAYLISNSSSHYAWAHKQIKRATTA